MIVRNFKGQKVADMIRQHGYRRVLLRLHHGLGDAVMFYSRIFRKLKQEFPRVEFYLDTHCGQEELFGDPDRNEAAYDVVFEIGMPCCEWDSRCDTKAERCAFEEIGIAPGPEDYTMPRRWSSPLVGVHFFSTCSRELCCPERLARDIWEMTAEAGMIPIDTHMKHGFAEPKNVPWTWETSNIYSAPATVRKLFGLIGSCAGFAGVVSGNLWAALSTLPPDKILVICTEFSVKRITRLPVHELNVRDGKRLDVVERWLRAVTKGIER